MRVFSFGAVIALVVMSIVACSGGAADPLEKTNPQATDTTAPRITSITGVSNGSKVAGRVHVEVSAYDENGVVALELLANGGLLTSAASGTLSYDWQTAEVDPGMYVMTAVASDAAGNDGSDSIYVYVMEYDGEDYVLEGDPTAAKPSDPFATQPTGPEVVVESPEIENEGADGVVDDGQTAVKPIDPVTMQPIDPEIVIELPELPEPETPTGDIPQLIISGLTDGQVIFGQHYISVIGISNVGINGIALLIDDVQVATTQEISLGYMWDTEACEDGLHNLTYFVRDLAGTIGRLNMQAEIDNATDYSPPVLQIEDSYWVCNGISGPLEVFQCGTCAFTVAEYNYFIFEALDESDIEYFEVTLGDDIAQNSNETRIEITLDEEYWETHDALQKISLTARDEYGNESTRNIKLSCMQTTSVAGDCPNHDGELIYDVDIYLLAGAIPNPADCDPEQAIDAQVLVAEKAFWFRDLEVGIYTVYFQYDGLEACQVTEAGPGLPGVDPYGFVYKPLD